MVKLTPRIAIAVVPLPVVTTLILIAATFCFLSNIKPAVAVAAINHQSIGTYNIALVKPTFTGAAYHQSFYKFYFIHPSMIQVRKNITTDLNLLSSKVTNQTGKSSSLLTFLYLPQHLKVLLPQYRISVLTDADVDYGSIFFKNGANKYDVVILGHQEYVTQREYSNLKHFVTDGGTLVLLDGNVFYAEVKYDRNSHAITLVKGHGWAYNGKSAWSSAGERWANETSHWVGSNYLCYLCKLTLAGNAFAYKHHEEQYITNPNDQILMNYNASIMKKIPKFVGKALVATYVLNYQKGKIIALGIYSDDLITNKKFQKYLDGLLIQTVKK
jgi:hypothetical protein